MNGDTWNDFWRIPAPPDPGARIGWQDISVALAERVVHFVDHRLQLAPLRRVAEEHRQRIERDSPAHAACRTPGSRRPPPGRPRRANGVSTQATQAAGAAIAVIASGGTTPRSAGRTGTGAGPGVEGRRLIQIDQHHEDAVAQGCAAPGGCGGACHQARYRARWRSCGGRAIRGTAVRQSIAARIHRLRPCQGRRTPPSRSATSSPAWMPSS